jgi:hypothetical protein
MGFIALKYTNLMNLEPEKLGIFEKIYSQSFPSTLISKYPNHKNTSRSMASYAQHQ